jgi:ABC-type bacteriocin/lantibiotic exporter with double-glycine peptidase domain
MINIGPINSKQKVNFILLILMQFIGSIVDLAGIGLVVPVVYLVNNSAANENFRIISSNLIKLAENPAVNFLLYLIILLFLFNLFKILYQVFLNFKKNTFAYNLRMELSTKLFDNFLNSEYSFFIKNNSSEIIRTTLTDVDSFVSQYLVPLSEILSDIVLLSIIIIISIIFQPILTIIIITLLLFFSLVINKKLSSISYEYGQKRVHHYTKSFQFLQEGIGAIKEIKIFRSRSFFVNRFKENYQNFINIARKHTLIVEIPRFSIELLVFLILVIIVFFQAQYKFSLLNILTSIGLFSLLSLRLMPIVNKIQTNFQIIHNNKFLVNQLNELLSSKPSLENNNKHTIETLFENELIRFSNVSFLYENSDKIVLDKINYNIYRGDILGIIGQSGSGKTTFLNLLLGLLNPYSGIIYFKNNNIKFHLESYISLIGYVPQFVYLLDDSVKNNITFGQNSELLDLDKIERLLLLLDLKKVVEEMPNGIESFLGDRGVTLSGGQIQRFGIARALYKEPEILILDESTSALDSDTQNIIIDGILKYNPNITIIFVTHREEVLKYCNKIIEIKNSQLTLINKPFKI